MDFSAKSAYGAKKYALRQNGQVFLRGFSVCFLYDLVCFFIGFLCKNKKRPPRARRNVLWHAFQALIGTHFSR